MDFSRTAETSVSHYFIFDYIFCVPHNKSVNSCSGYIYSVFVKTSVPQKPGPCQILLKTWNFFLKAKGINFSNRTAVLSMYSKYLDYIYGHLGMYPCTHPHWRSSSQIVGRASLRNRACFFLFWTNFSLIL
jgi:hypothetical protein